jgi:Dna[CI] antecedent, DciA
MPRCGARRLSSKLTHNKDFRTVYASELAAQTVSKMEKTKSINELLRVGGRLVGLNRRVRERSRVLEEVRASLPARLAQAVISAGVEEGRLTIGVVGSVWASRIRYFSEATRLTLSERLGTQLLVVRVRVVPTPQGT